MTFLLKGNKIIWLINKVIKLYNIPQKKICRKKQIKSRKLFGLYYKLVYICNVNLRIRQSMR